MAGSSRKRRFKCPVCANFTLEDWGAYDICKVCFWEDDGIREPERYSGPNHMTLAEGRDAYARFGAVEQRFVSKVRAPTKRELPQNQPPA